MTTIVTATELQNVLQDYKILLTDIGSAQSQRLSSSESISNLPDWPTEHFRIPDYRPVNKHLDPKERPNGSSVPEKIFLILMFTGVFLNATSAKIWGRTGGPYFPRLFRYAIGGEW